MSDEIVFVLHQSAEETYAAALAAALTPRLAFPTSEAAARDLSFGAGARCVILWTPEWASSGSAANLADLAVSGPRKALVVCLRDAEPAPEFVAAGFVVIRAGADVVADAASLNAALDALVSEAEARDGGYRARLGSRSQGPAPGRGLSRKFVTRSAMGLAATFCVVFFASHYFLTPTTAGVHGGATTMAADLDPVVTAPTGAVAPPIETIAAASSERATLPESARAPEPSAPMLAVAARTETRGPDGISTGVSELAPLPSALLIPLAPPATSEAEASSDVSAQGPSGEGDAANGQSDPDVTIFGEQ